MTYCNRMVPTYTNRMLPTYGDRMEVPGGRSNPGRIRHPGGRYSQLPTRAKEERGTAIHESAHALVSVLVGLGIERVSLGRTADGRGVGECVIRDEPYRPPETFNWTPGFVRQVRATVFPSLAAGYAAEVSVGCDPDPYETSDDFEQATRLARCMYPGDQREQDAAVWGAVGDCRELFRDPRAEDAVCWLADALESHRRLSGDWIVPRLMPRIRGLRVPTG